MNEQSTKKIFFNKSILISLKAELIKKQEEVEVKKRLPQHKLENFKPSSKAGETVSGGESNSNKKSFRDKLKAVDVDELEACRKTKAALEKKAELYDHLADGAGDSELAGHFLVNFKEKKEQQPQVEIKTPEYEEDTTIDDCNEWTEFTDFLGRTRKCLKSDLDYYKKRNQDLIKAVTKHTEEPATGVPESSQQSEKPILVQKTNDYLQSLREKWEKKEMELLAKDKDVHYQDLLFDEARIHGVGYYSFSTDETERSKQMEELLRKRQETLQAQEQAAEARKKRDELVAARVAAARARRRARAGLPPEDPEEKKKDFTTCLLEFLTEKKNEADSKAKEEEQKAREEREKERQKLREAYVREWDLGKEGVEGKVKKFREMTQEEYVDQQRSKRIDEFAPIQDKKAASSSKSNYNFDNHGNKIDSNCDSNVPEKNWSDVRQFVPPPPPIIGDLSLATKGLYFSSKNPETVVKYKNFVQSQEPVPIDNELESDVAQISKQQAEKRKPDREYAEIEPPLTFDYFGPNSKQKKIQKPFNSDLREAFAQGSKSLEPKDTKIHLPQQYDFTFD